MSLLQHRFFLVKAVTIAGLLSSLAMAPKLWLSSRMFPLAPLFDLSILPAIPPPWDLVFFVTLLLFIAAIPFLPRSRAIIWPILAIFALFLFQDQTRFQPYIYQFLAMLFLLSFTSGSEDYEADIMRSYRLILASIYFWSGAQKCNSFFPHDVVPWLLSPYQDLFPAWLTTTLLRVAPGIPIIEMLIGGGLLLPKIRLVAAIAAIAMHLFLLLTLGPTGHNWNSVVWPWNIAMILFAALLFLDPEASSRFPRKEFLPGRLTVIFFTIMPFFNFIGLWDSYPSFSLYSSLPPDAALLVPAEDRRCIPETLHPLLIANQDHTETLNLMTWAIEELNVTTYPEPRVYRAIAETICRCGGRSSGIELIVIERPNRFQLTSVMRHYWSSGADCRYDRVESENMTPEK